MWQAPGFSLFAYFATLMAKSFAAGTGDPGFVWSFAVVFMVYGVALITSGELGESQILHRAGFVALRLVPYATWFDSTAVSWLLTSS